MHGGRSRLASYKVEVTWSSGDDHAVPSADTFRNIATAKESDDESVWSEEV